MAKTLLLLFAFALFWMKDPLIVGGLPAFPADLFFLIAGLAWVAAFLTGTKKLQWSDGFWPLLVYFVALTISAACSSDPRTSTFKLATQAYLMAIPVLSFNLIDGWDDVRRLVLAYIAGAAVVALIGVATLILFPFFGYHSFLSWPLHHFGTLPPGPYPRLETTFEYPAMMANYLSLALMLLILAERRGWVGPSIARPLGLGMLVTAFFALTPGLNGLFLMLGVWLWHRNRGTPKGRLFLWAGLAAGALGVVLAAVTPILHPTAPFLISIPGVPVVLAPSVRLLAWIDAVRTFIAHPLVGIGIGGEPVHVPYVNPSGEFTVVTDAHNMPLSVAAQAGIFGLVGMATIIIFAVRQMRRGSEMVFGLSLAFVSGLVVEGLVGSFEDARHLWLAYGLILVARKLEGAPPRAPMEQQQFSG